ncbi:uncharacterized protein PAN0_002c1104 [Moesziomyces antarcticus]|uniref:FHA domain-containing protein n=1 Tax=Pseudozyma antarctica TaxID=84753 RepID=A0A5C3FGT7_PSEA2|nr:uncharacterized protein PAN0_002c1104 [Moesziomyces antarcticus]GAK62902.1 conserved hypothetical protein [Moesziomyces antarcticus]SPO43623.1 uncharacterized protein PSANT_01308 [Moesziomyces antarcticus]
MWLLQGRFAEDSRQELSKLLKYGQTYTIGRKIPADIVVDSKFVSRNSCHITIASEQSIEARLAAVTDPLAFHNDISLRPRVTIRFEANKSRKTFAVTKQSAPTTSTATTDPTDAIEVHVPPDQQHTLEHGDSFALTTTISLRLVWQPFAVCFAARIKDNAIAPLRKPALQLGIHLSPAKSRWKDGYTHLCLAQLNSTESVLCALLQARPLVSIDYFHELFRRAELPRHDPASLETTFDDLSPAAYAPPVDPGELSELIDTPNRLVPDQRRTYMLKATMCVFFALPSDQAEVTIYKNVLAVAGAHVFTHNPVAEKLETKADFAQLLMPYKNSALSYWRNSSAQARSEAPDDGLVVLVSGEHADSAWGQACAVACSNLRIAMPTGFHGLTSAILTADVRAHLNVFPKMPDDGGASMLPPATMPVSSPPPPPSTPQIREETRSNDASARKQPSPKRIEAPAAAPVERRESLAIDAPISENVPPPQSATEGQRRPLTRRTRKPVSEANEASSHTTAMDPPSISAPTESTDAHAAGAEASESLEPQGGLQTARSARSGLTRRTGATRTNSRRSDIFDAILQPGDANASADASANTSGSVETQAGGTTSVPRSRRYRMDLDEEDRAQTQSLVDAQASSQSQAVDLGKRKSPPPVVGDETAHTSKRTRTEATAADPAPEATRIVRADTDAAQGLAEGAQPDTEPHFLAALNTQRAQVSAVDDFDADFNRLTIAKGASGPLDRHVASRSTKAQAQPARKDAAVDENYEAFKRMAEEELRMHVRGNFVQVDFVPLVRKPTARTATATNAGPNFKKFRRKAEAGTPRQDAQVSRTQVALTLPESNDYGLGEAYWEQNDETSLPHEGAAATRRGRAKVALDPASVEGGAVDLGLDGLDEESDDGADMTTLLERRHGRPSQRASQARGRKRPVAMVDESDDEVVPSRVVPRAAVKAAKTSAAMVIDDDEDSDEDADDDGNFAGFGRSSSTRRRRDVPATASGRTRRTAF